MTKKVLLLCCAAALAYYSAFALGQATTRQFGTRRVVGSGDSTGDGSSLQAAKDSDTSDVEQRKILDAARQLKLDKDQRTQLDSSLNALKGESTELKKALEDARAALAHALQDGQSSLDNEIENLASATAKVQELKLKRWASLYAVLTPDQQRQLLMMSTPLSELSSAAKPLQTQ
jgi:Spy/CpxP family protein refolding chaperone